ncbi:MAG TPA: hypothetical protein PLP31_14425, partial [Thermoanaerobaculaceae bacterium]|nr:hypothetical protein [Thermoanaerobaculaceae bacterium]
GWVSFQTLPWVKIRPLLTDLVFCGIVWVLNKLRIHNDSPPLLEFGRGVSTAYLLLFLLVAYLAFLAFGRRVPPRRLVSSRITLVLAALFAVRCASNLLDFRVPTNVAQLFLERHDLARLKATHEAIVSVSEAIEQHYRHRRAVPDSIRELRAEGVPTTDGWGFTLVYSPNLDRCGYELRAKGVPSRAAALEGFQLEKVARMCKAR